VKKLARLLLPMVIAVVLGPLVAGLAVCLLAVYTNVSDPATALPLADLFVMFAIYISFAYLEGAPIALLAGLLVSIWMLFRPPGLVVAVVAAALAVALFRLAAEFAWLGPIRGGLALNNFRLLLALAVVAAAVCWLLMRRFAARDTATS
jgi:hypothetical protein